MIKVLSEKDYNFFFLMGKWFADRSIIKEMDSQIYSSETMNWYIYFDKEGKICGFASVEPKKDHLYLDNFFVIEKARNKGIGREILEKVLKENKGEIRLISRNDVAVKMFMKRGFIEIGKKGRYSKMVRKGVNV